MSLNGQQAKQLYTALLNSLNTRADLEKMLFFQMNVRLNQISGAGSLSDTVFEVIQWSEAYGRIEEFVSAARRQFPSDEALAAFEANFGGHNLPTSAAIPLIRTATAVREPSNIGPATIAATELVEVFFSYAHEDETLRDELAKHLKLLQRQGVISAWHDRRITPGEEWKGEIDAHLESARIILLLVTADFMASDYCWDVETERAMQRHTAGEAVVIPIALRPVDWHNAPFAKLQGLPKDAKPITSWPNRDEAFLDVAQGIRKVATHLSGR